MTVSQESRRREAQALVRLKKASRIVAALIDAEIDPPWVDSQELENAAIAYGRILNERDK